MDKVSDQLWSWASDIEPNTLAQAEMLSRLPIIDGHVALMPDAHLGIGSTVGSVIPTTGAVIPAAVGVDIGCFAGDTLVPVADGKSYPMSELAERSDGR